LMRQLVKELRKGGGFHEETSVQVLDALLSSYAERGGEIERLREYPDPDSPSLADKLTAAEARVRELEAALQKEEIERSLAQKDADRGWAEVESLRAQLEAAQGQMGSLNSQNVTLAQELVRVRDIVRANAPRCECCDSRQEHALREARSVILNGQYGNRLGAALSIIDEVLGSLSVNSGKFDKLVKP
jgi:chromosome segregation ATPase